MRYVAKIIFVLSAIILISGLVIWLFIPHKINAWTCSQTGSSKGNEIWGDFLVAKQYTQISPLEQRMRDENISFVRDWVQTCNVRKFGLTTTYSCGRAPAMYYFPYDLQTIFANYATRTEVLQLCSILRNNNISKEQKEQAVTKACHRALDYFEKEISQTR